MSSTTLGGPNGKGHAPWVGATINYTPGNAEYTPAAQKTGTIDVNMTARGILKDMFW